MSAAEPTNAPASPPAGEPAAVQLIEPPGGATALAPLAAPAPGRRRDALAAAALAAVLAGVYSANGGFLPGNDATPSVHLAAQLLEGGGLAFSPSSAPQLFDWTIETWRGPRPVRVMDLDDRLGGSSARELHRRGDLRATAPYYLTESVRRDPATGERLYVGLYGVGAAISAVPVLAAVRAVVGDLGDPAALWYGAKLAATLYAAASAGLLFLLARRFASTGWALVLALAYALGTPVWSVSSQALWQHAPNELFLVLGALAIVRARGSAAAAAVAGASFAAATACRPTSALFAVAAAIWLLRVDRRSLAAFAAGALPLALALGAYNAWFLGSPLRFGQGEATAVALAKTGSPELWRPHLATALAGLLASPGRGVLVYSPFLVLSLAGAVLAARREAYAPLRPLLLGAALVLCVDAAWFDWWGGWSYGWRRLVDLAPVLVVLLVPVLPALARSRPAAIAFGAALAWAVLLQLVGAVAYDLDGWNARRAWRLVRASGEAVVVLDEPSAREEIARGARAVAALRLDVDLPEHRGRLWSVRDNPVSYYLGHFDESRRRREEMVEGWLTHWRPQRPLGR